MAELLDFAERRATKLGRWSADIFKLSFLVPTGVRLLRQVDDFQAALTFVTFRRCCDLLSEPICLRNNHCIH
jgi:hypothetical protein